MNDAHNFSTDYRGLLVAKITAVHTPASGPLVGRKVYEWTEQTFDPTSGAEITALPPREGVYRSAVEFWNCLLDPNDADHAVDSFVWARMKGAVTGITVYETVAGAGGGDSSILVLLTEKSYGAQISYSAVEVESTTYAVKTGGLTFSPGTTPLYHEEDWDFAVVGLTGAAPRFVHPWSIFRARQYPDGVWRFRGHPNVELYRRTGTEDADGEEAFKRVNTANTGITWGDTTEVRLIEAE